ncbi:MAG: hypothetical protein JWO52_3336 [Gammaproteobacteria bacterium]|nr:hypothetical protein [Gammaproteobacteria bacterium]
MLEDEAMRMKLLTRKAKREFNASIAHLSPQRQKELRAQYRKGSAKV